MNRTFARPLNAGGTNAQGVPLGLVNYMVFNRMRLPRTSYPPCRIDEPPVLEGRVLLGDYHIGFEVWRDLSLTPRDEFPCRGFLTITGSIAKRY